MSSVAVGGRVDIKSLALVADLAEELKMPSVTKSDLLWKAVEIAATVAKKRGMRQYETAEEAMQSLHQRGLNLGTSERGRRSVAKVLQDEVMDLDFEGVGTKRVTKSMLATNPKMEYALACMTAREYGIEPPSFEEFLKRKEELATKQPPLKNSTKDESV